MRILVVIVNYRTGALVEECLASLEAEVAALPGTRVVVADNASGDDSVAVLTNAIRERSWGAWAEVLELPVNGGFAYGNNAAILPALASEAPPDYVWMLNPDTYVRPGALAVLVDFLEEHPDVGLAGGRVEGPDGVQQDSCFNFHSTWTELEHGVRLGVVSRLLATRKVAIEQPTVATPIGWAMGASLLARRAVFQDIGGMDEGYFLYYEETDFCLRAARAGWKTWYVPGSAVVHLVGQSTGVTAIEGPPKRRPRYWFESRRRYFEKNHGRAYALWIDLVWLVAYGSFCFRNLFQRKATDDPPFFLRDFVAFTFGASSGSESVERTAASSVRDSSERRRPAA